MKSLKLDHSSVQQILDGSKNSTWRINDDKDLHVNDRVSLVDKIDPIDPGTWKVFGEAFIDLIVEKRLGDISKEDLSNEKSYSTVNGVIEQFKKYYGPTVDKDTPIKMIKFTFRPVEPRQMAPDDVRKTSILEEIKLFADGGSRGNPGPSASGYALMDMRDTVILENGLYLGVTTNNQAEYQALKIGLEEALKRGAQIVHVYMDSLLVINQMKSIYKVKNRDLIPINDSIRKLVPHFKKVTFTHVPRELNKIADGVVNNVLDSVES